MAKSKKILAIYKDISDETGMFVGHDIWLSDEVHTYYIGMNTGVVGRYGSSTGYFEHFSATYNMYNVAEELFDCIGADIKFASITLA